MNAEVLLFILFRQAKSNGRVRFSHAIDMGSSYVLFFQDPNGKQIMDGGIRFWPETREHQIFNPMQLTKGEFDTYKKAKHLTLIDMMSRKSKKEVGNGLS